MKKSNQAIAHFKTLNCAQSVLLTFARDLNLDENTVLLIASGFGSGMTMGETCGAVTGAYMAMGLGIQTEGKTIPQIKAESKARVRKFNDLFIARHGSLKCKKLLDVDISTPEGTALAIERNLFETLCVDLVASATEIVEDNF